MYAERVEQLTRESLPQLLRELTVQTTTLVRHEIDLNAGFIGAAAIFALGAFDGITACVINAIALAVPVWAAALVVSVIYAIVALVVAQAGRRKIDQMTPAPHQVAQSIKDDIEWVKTRAR